VAGAGRQMALAVVSPPALACTPMQYPSYAHGTTSTPLLGETIGENLRRTVARWGDREALV